MVESQPQKSPKAAPTALSKVPKGRGQPSGVLQPRPWAEYQYLKLKKINAVHLCGIIHLRTLQFYHFLDEASQKFGEIAQLIPIGMGKDTKGKYLPNKQELGITFSSPEHMAPAPSPGQCAQLLLHQKSLSSAWTS